MLDLSNLRITVMGLGRFGGGIGVTRFLASQDADVLVTDQSPAADLSDSVEQISDLVKSGCVRLRLGEHNISDFTDTDLVIANPAVSKPWENRFLRAATAAKVPITTEIQLVYERLPNHARVIAITGSVGKSTTTAMIHHALSSLIKNHPALASQVFLGGNIGGTLLPSLPSIDTNALVVLELSSAMLWWLSRGFPSTDSTSNADLSPSITAGLLPPVGVAVVTNISANHLDWHGDFHHYSASKQVLVRSLPSSSTAVLVDPSVRDWKSITKAKTVIPNPAAWTAPMLLPGAHNVVNASAALEAAAAILNQQHRVELSAALSSFGGLAHRLQLVCNRPIPGGSIRCYNDSKSTTPESCLKAIDAVASVLPTGPRGIHLIAGGYDKKISLQSIADAAASLAGIYTLGVTGPMLAQQSLAAGAIAHNCSTLRAAVAAALLRAKPDDAILLSPGCASWDQYTNFEARGEEFIRLISS